MTTALWTVRTCFSPHCNLCHRFGPFPMKARLQLYISPALWSNIVFPFVCISEQKIFPYTALTDWFLQPRYWVFTARYGLNLRVMFINFSKPSGHCMYTSSSKLNNSMFCPHSVFMSFLSSQNEQRLLPYTELAEWFLQPRQKVFTCFRAEFLQVLGSLRNF